MTHTALHKGIRLLAALPAGRDFFQRVLTLGIKASDGYAAALYENFSQSRWQRLAGIADPQAITAQIASALDSDALPATAFARASNLDQDQGKLQCFAMQCGKSPVVLLLWSTLNLTEEGHPQADFFSVLAQRIEAEWQEHSDRDRIVLAEAMVRSTPHLLSFVDHDYRYRVVSPGYEQLFQRSADGLVGSHVADVHGDAIFESRMKPHIDRSLAGETVVSRRWVEPVGGEPRYIDVVQAPCFDREGRLIGVVTSAHDVTSTKRHEDAISEMAHLDPLTGLPNRRYLFERLGEEIAKCRRHKQTAVLLFIDLDGFKTVNDRYGHTVGDRVLERVSQRLRASVRKEDVLARFGGDEFVLLVANAWTQDSAYQESHLLARKILAELAQPIVLDECVVNIDASVGIHQLGENDQSVDDVIRRADLAMYSAKQRGRNEISMG